MADIAEKLALPVILVVGMRLGCLNHALLTRDAHPRARTAVRRLDREQDCDSEMPLAEREYRHACASRFGVPPLAVVPAGERVGRLGPSRSARLGVEVARKLVSP